MVTCSCNDAFANTGKPTCDAVAAVAKKYIAVALVADDGTDNYINVADGHPAINQAYFDALINHSDPSKRWYPTPELKNITSDKADSLFQEFDDGAKVFIQEGPRSFTGLIVKASGVYLGKLKSLRCREFGLYEIDKNGNLIGSLDEAGKLYPIRVDNNSWDPKLVKATDKTLQNIMLGFNFHIDQADENLEMILAADISPVNLLRLEGLIDLNGEFADVTTTGFTVTIRTDFGSVVDKQLVTGLVAADMALYNDTDSASVTIVSVTETSDGVYDVTYAAQTAGDDLLLTITKDGYDGAALAQIAFS